ncbi:quinolinate synthase NadA [Helicobacter cetorum]|uniref:Quinolinate synthase n=1 Tax=Helicobacter cetorum (strain ATCC BAA-429 / MIT 00-7128) TaxID=182217 RepID=I0EKL7_HELC0|nr:quinolinate synthase NadA [Helicobacter cetorum]AFI03486.1 quinolinate synthetase [Helicobacter cetorum MIT 00-7128]
MQTKKDLKASILELLNDLNALMVAHFYQKDEIVELAHHVGDSLELAKKASQSDKNLIVFCGVHFMGESVKALAFEKQVIMPKLSCCSMARMIDSHYYNKSVDLLKEYGIKEFYPITYINSNAEVKAKVAQDNGVVCTSRNAPKIFDYALKQNKKIFFLPDKCLGENLALENDLKSAILGINSKEEIQNADVICYNGFCSVHQLFKLEDIEFYRQKYPDILIAVHPECEPSVVQNADFSGSTSQIIEFVENLSLNQKVAIGTESNLVNRLKAKRNHQNTFILSSSLALCPTMNETTLEDVFEVLKAYKNHRAINTIELKDEVAYYAKIALTKMMELS